MKDVVVQDRLEKMNTKQRAGTPTVKRNFHKETKNSELASAMRFTCHGGWWIILLIFLTTKNVSNIVVIYHTSKPYSTHVKNGKNIQYANRIA